MQRTLVPKDSVSLFVGNLQSLTHLHRQQLGYGQVKGLVHIMQQVRDWLHHATLVCGQGMLFLLCQVSQCPDSKAPGIILKQVRAALMPYLH